MLTVVAESVISGVEAFETLGEVAVVPDDEICASCLVDADLLIVRSKTKVDADLLEGTPVKFVGTATAGYDHIDTAWLDANEIGWSVASGCNANAVSEYVIAALLKLHGSYGISLSGKTIAIVGVGNVGQRVASKATALGMRVLRNDPPLAARSPDPDFQSLEEILPSADVITLHIPLTSQKPWPTRRLANYRFFSQIKPGAIFINSSRGRVVDQDALMCAIDGGVLSKTVLDVWDPEPQIPAELVEKVDLGTPHIAGYSYEGALNGTRSCYQSACRYFELAPVWDPEIPNPPVPEIRLDTEGRDEEDLLQEAIGNLYDIAVDDRRLRYLANLEGKQRALAFKRLRREYSKRREFSNTVVSVPHGSPSLLTKLRMLGFHVAN